jgi:predicted DNA-binding protein (MmcQ/YjbR family)
MTLDEYNAFCASLPHTSHVVQWRGAHVWKVGGPSGKVFAIGRWLEPDADPDVSTISFKCSPMSYEMLCGQPGLIPAPHLASRGMKWVQRTGDESMDDAALMDYLRESHRQAGLNLTKKVRIELGML